MRSVRRAIMGISPSAYVVLANIITGFVKIISSMILTRLLSPADFGISGFIGSIFAALALISDVGFQAYIIRHPNGDNRNFIDALWIIHALRGVLLFMLAIIISYLIEFDDHLSTMGPLMRLACFLFIFEGLSSLMPLVFLRHGAVMRLTSLELISLIVQFPISISLAFLLRDAWALIYSMILGSFLRCLLSYYLYNARRHKLLFDKRLASEFASFSMPILLSSSITLLITQMDKIALSKLLSISEFGGYILANNMTSPLVNVAFSLAGRIIGPSFAMSFRQGSARLSDAYYSCRDYIYYSFFLLVGGISGASNLIIHIMYDKRYSDAGFYLGLLSIPAAMSLTTRSMSEAANTLNRTGTTLKMNIGRAIWLAIGGFCLYVTMGVNGVIYALSLVELPAYFVGLISLRKYGILKLRYELIPFILIFIGFLCGILLNSIFASLNYLK